MFAYVAVDYGYVGCLIVIVFRCLILLVVRFALVVMKRLC